MSGRNHSVHLRHHHAMRRVFPRGERCTYRSLPIAPRNTAAWERAPRGAREFPKGDEERERIIGASAEASPTIGARDLPRHPRKRKAGSGMILKVERLL